jgi:phenylpropionate dioxygenase-like ring-hydroxylating dioxygenase large terminal subunit
VVWVRGARSADVTRTVLVWRMTHRGQTRIVLLWRTRRGEAVATEASCPHRDYLMVDARLVRDAVECPVHGYRFGADGRCVNVRSSPAARIIDAREADGYVWLAS